MRNEAMHAVITCIMPAGLGRDVHNRLMREHGVLSASTHHARGLGSRRARRMVYEEKDVLVALVEDERADELFAFLHEAAGVGEPHAGLIFMTRAARGRGMAPFDFLEAMAAA